MQKTRWNQILIVFLLIANMIIPWGVWHVAKDYIWTETEILLGAISTAVDVDSIAYGFQKYIAADVAARADYALVGEQTINAAGYSFSASKYIKSNLGRVFMPFTFSELIIEVALIVVVLYRSQYFKRCYTRVQRKQAEIEEQLKSMVANQEILLGNIDHYEENLYHQLKTPLTSLQLCLDQLQPSEVDSSREQMAYRMAKLQVHKLSRLISLFLRNRRLSSNSIKFHHRLTALDFLVEDAAQQLQSQAELNQVTIRRELPQDNCFLRCDETWLSECVITLLENAIEHSPEHSEIKVTLIHGNGEYRLKVLSPGVQLDPDELSLIFERFHSTNPGHFGIGLHMARMVAENHHGELVAYNMEDELQGACFELILPILDSVETYNVTIL